MPTCYLLPGIMGSELELAHFPFTVVWVSYTQIALGGIGKLRLAADGINPGQPDGTSLRPSGLLADYYQILELTLRSGLSANNYSVVSVEYDWRLRVETNGLLLAQRIIDDNDANNPCSIVAHSLGGMVSLSAWRRLKSIGKENLVRRIVTLGTPYLGSYRPVLVFSKTDELIEQIRFISGLVRALVTPVGGHILLPEWNDHSIAQLTMSWPSMYELMPVVNPLTLTTDPNRSRLYNAANWPAFLRPSQAWLTHALHDISPWLSEPASYPGDEILTVVAGTGYPTPSSLATPADLGEPTAIHSIDDGDGMVTVDSATYPRSAKYVLPCAHVDLARASVSLDILPGLVLAVRPPLPPQPATQVRGGSLQRLLTGPPFNGLVKLDQDC